MQLKCSVLIRFLTRKAPPKRSNTPTATICSYECRSPCERCDICEPDMGSVSYPGKQPKVAHIETEANVFCCRLHASFAQHCGHKPVETDGTQYVIPLQGREPNCIKPNQIETGGNRRTQVAVKEASAVSLTTRCSMASNSSMQFPSIINNDT